MRAFFTRLSLFTLFVSSFCAVAAVDGRRDIMVASPDLNKVIAQTTTSAHQIYFELCDVDLGKFKTPADVSLVLNSESVACQSIANLKLDLRDERALKFLRNSFVGPLELLAPSIAAPKKSDAIFYGVAGTLEVPIFTMIATDFWDKRFFDRHARSKFIGRPQILISAALAEAYLVTWSYFRFQRAREIEKLGPHAHLIGLSGDLARQPYPVVGSEGFNAFATTLAEAIYKTADAITIR